MKHKRPETVKDLIIVSDIQSPFIHHAAWSLALEYIRMTCARAKRKSYPKPMIILNGDIPDFYVISHHRKVGRGPSTLLEEINVTNKEVLDRLETAHGGYAEVHWVAGNHEARMENAIALAAAQPGPGGAIIQFIQQSMKVSVQHVFRTVERGIKYYEAKDGKTGIMWVMEPELLVLHGRYTTQRAAKAHLTAIGTNLIHGHVHREQTERDTKAITGESQIALSSGCLCADPDWNSLDRYDRGFVAGWFDPHTRVFSVDHKHISGDGCTQLYCEYGLLQAVHIGNDNWRVDRL